MINNDRILANVATASLVSGIPDSLSDEKLRCKNGTTKRRRHMNVAFKKPVKPARSLDSIAEALLLPTGIDGVYARTAIFEKVVDGLGDASSRPTATPTPRSCAFRR